MITSSVLPLVWGSSALHTRIARLHSIRSGAARRASPAPTRHPGLARELQGPLHTPSARAGGCRGSLVGQWSFLLDNSLLSHARTIVHSPSTVRLETPSAVAISSIFMPPKKRN